VIPVDRSDGLGSHAARTLGTVIGCSLKKAVVVCVSRLEEREVDAIPLLGLNIGPCNGVLWVLEDVTFRQDGSRNSLTVQGQSWGSYWRPRTLLMIVRGLRRILREE